MSGSKCTISIIIVLSLLLSIQGFSQPVSYRDSLSRYNFQKADLKPALHYSVGSTFIVVPHLGSVTGFTLSPFLSVPLSSKFSVEGGIIAGRYYSALGNINPEIPGNGAFNELSVYGSASYHFNSQLTLYGAGIKQLAGNSPFYLPKSSYTIGTNYNFGTFSLGFAVQVSKWDNNFSPFPIKGSQGFYSPYEQRSGAMVLPY